MKKRALISVYDKTNVVELAKKLGKFGYEIVSTGGTYELLRAENINVTEVSSVTGFEEILNGKVKTLHPHIFGGILVDFENKAELEQIAKKAIEPFSIVVVNLYPFEQVVKTDFEESDLVKNIDIGGVSLLRAAAKNYKNVAVVSSVSQYDKLAASLDVNTGSVDIQLRKELAVAAFEHTSVYDALISKTLAKTLDVEQQRVLFDFEKVCDLRYGENPHQKASLLRVEGQVEFDLLNGKELSYNNIVDVSAATAIVSEFYDVNAVAIVKHTIPCGVALGKDINDAYLKAFDVDPISAFGGIIAFSKPVDVKTAEHASSVFLEVVIAPDYEADALELLKKKKNLRIIRLKTPLSHYKTVISQEIKLTPFGALLQDFDKKELDKDTFKVVTKQKPTPELIEDLVFAWKVAKHVKSNAIVIAKDFRTLAIAGGQTSRVDAVELALNKCVEGSKDACLASDGFFPAIDNIQAAAQGRIGAIIQPAGSIKDADVIAACDKFGISMVTTGIRHFKH